MGPSARDIRPSSPATKYCLGDNKGNDQASCHDDQSQTVAVVTEKDFVKEWLWRRSSHNQADSPIIQRDSSPAEIPHTTLRSPDVHIPNNKHSHNPAGPRSEQEMDGQNLNFVLNRMESRSSEEKSWTPSDYGSYYSQRSLINSYNKEKCHWSGYCKAFVVISILLLVAWGIAVPLYFTVGPGTLPWDADIPPTTHVEAQMASVVGNKQPRGIVFTAVNCSIRIINQQFTHYLQNKYSSEFQSLRVKIESLLGKVFYKEKHFNKAVVTSFSPGSIVVQFVLLFTKKRSDIKEYTHHVLVNHIMTHWSMLGTYRTDLGSIQVNYISNKCAKSNGGCSHICVWLLLGDGYECQCPAGYSIMSDSRTCFQTARSTTLSPCGEDQFLCRSGSCIPHQWVCDGVRDCMMGEDESHNVCRFKTPANMPPAPPVPLPQQQVLPQKDIYYTDLNHKQDDPRQDTKFIQNPKQNIPSNITAIMTEPTSQTMPITIWEKQKPRTIIDFKIPGLENDLNGSKLKDNGKIKDPSSSALFRRFKFFG